MMHGANAPLMKVPKPNFNVENNLNGEIEFEWRQVFCFGGDGSLMEIFVKIGCSLEVCIHF